MRTLRPVLAGIILISPLNTAATGAIVECRAELPAERSGRWAWRNIDGKRCWYQGQRGMAKANLRWSAPEVEDESPQQEAAPELAADSTEDAALLESYWPPQSERELTFEERWPRELMKD